MMVVVKNVCLELEPLGRLGNETFEDDAPVAAPINTAAIVVTMQKNETMRFNEFDNQSSMGNVAISQISKLKKCYGIAHILPYLTLYFVTRFSSRLRHSNTLVRCRYRRPYPRHCSGKGRV